MRMIPFGESSKIAAASWDFVSLRPSRVATGHTLRTGSTGPDSLLRNVSTFSLLRVNPAPDHLVMVMVRTTVSHAGWTVPRAGAAYWQPTLTWVCDLNRTYQSTVVLGWVCR
jgi:hypothetical protein